MGRISRQNLYRPPIKDDELQAKVRKKQLTSDWEQLPKCNPNPTKKQLIYPQQNFTWIPQKVTPHICFSPEIPPIFLGKKNKHPFRLVKKFPPPWHEPSRSPYVLGHLEDPPVEPIMTMERKGSVEDGTILRFEDLKSFPMLVMPECKRLECKRFEKKKPASSWCLGIFLLDLLFWCRKAYIHLHLS